MCIIGHWKVGFCRPESAKRADYQAWVYRTWIHVLVRTEEGQNLHILLPPPPSTYDVNGKIFDTVKTVAFVTKGILTLNNGNKIVSCFNYSSMCIIYWTLKRVFFSCSESVKRGDFQAWLLRAWVHVLVGTEEGATIAHFTTHPSSLKGRCKWKNIWHS